MNLISQKMEKESFRRLKVHVFFLFDFFFLKPLLNSITLTVPGLERRKVSHCIHRLRSAKPHKHKH